MITKESNTISIEQIIFQGTFNSLSNDFVISDNLNSVHMLGHEQPIRLIGMSVTICKKGSARVGINLKSYNIYPGDIVVSLPEHIIQVNNKSDDFQAIFLVFSRNFLRSLPIDITTTIPTHLNIKDNPCRHLSNEQITQLTQIHSMLLDRVKKTTHRYRTEITRNLLSAAFYELSAIYCMESDQITIQDKSRKEEIFDQFHDLLSVFFRDSRNVGFYASKLAISPKYLSSAVKQVSGKSALGWINEYVVLESKSLLRFSQMTVQQVSDMLNFPNQSFFGKYFKHHTGLSPRRYKSRIAAGENI